PAASARTSAASVPWKSKLLAFSSSTPAVQWPGFTNRSATSFSSVFCGKMRSLTGSMSRLGLSFFLSSSFAALAMVSESSVVSREQPPQPGMAKTADNMKASHRIDDRDRPRGANAEAAQRVDVDFNGSAMIGQFSIHGSGSASHQD